MKRILPLLLTFLLVSCSEKMVASDMLKAWDKTIPQVTEHYLLENKTFCLVFSETVEVKEVLLEGEALPSGYLGKAFRFDLPKALEAGETAHFSLTVEKTNGNSSRCSFTLRGENLHPAKLLLNEVSIKGTASSPDRVELLVREAGNTVGMYLTDSSSDKGYLLPSIEVKANDLLVVYWNVKTTKTVVTHEDESFLTYYLNADSDHTLSGTNGALMIRESEEGAIQDALLYTDGATTLYGGYGTQKTEDTAEVILAQEQWSGEPLDSSLVTSSRVFVRLPGGIDSDSAEDWFTSAARTSTFGDRNTYHPYEAD